MNEGQYDSKNVEHISIENIEVVSNGECEIIWTTRENPDFMRVYAA